MKILSTVYEHKLYIELIISSPKYLFAFLFTITARFVALEEPLQEREVLLDDSLKFYQYKRDVEDAQLWIEEKEPVLKSENLGDSLHDVQRLKKRHSVCILVFVKNLILIFENFEFLQISGF